MIVAKPKATLVLSGKGGVGKTLVSVNLALYLKDKGVKVGLLDADFSASNTGYFLKLGDKSMEMAGEKFHPVNYEGIEVFSIPLFMGEKSVSMFGDQYAQLFRDAVESATWDVDYMVVDLPAGFGDELKTAARVFSDSLVGSVIVVQPAHYLDAKRAIQLHMDLEMPILGLIENMSYFKAGAIKYSIFGDSVVDKLGVDYQVPVFGRIPLSMDIRKQVEEKNPKLTGEYAEPVQKAVDAILTTSPKKPGFLGKVKKIFKAKIDKFLIELGLSINKELNILDIQHRFGYPGGSIIRLNLMDERMEKVLKPSDWLIDDGKLTAVEGVDYNVDVEIYIVLQALKWAFLGNHVMSDGLIFTFRDVWRLGYMQVYGDRSMVRVAHFIGNVFEEVSNNQKAMTRIRPTLEVLDEAEAE